MNEVTAPDGDLNMVNNKIENLKNGVKASDAVAKD